MGPRYSRRENPLQMTSRDLQQQRMSQSPKKNPSSQPGIHISPLTIFSTSVSMSDPTSDTYPPPPSDTLYSSSPHAPIDKREARRKLKAQHRAGHYSDPSYITFLVLVLALLYWFLPIPGIFEYLYARRSARNTPFKCNAAGEVLLKPTMPWQKQFTLNSRSKGCHLIQHEIMPHLEEGLKGVKVGVLTLFIQHTSAALTLNENFDKDVRTDMDMVSRTENGWRSSIPCWLTFELSSLNRRHWTRSYPNRCRGSTPTKAPTTRCRTPRPV